MLNINKTQTNLTKSNLHEMFSRTPEQDRLLPKEVLTKSEIFSIFDEITSELNNVQIKLEHCHRQTKSEPKHVALGEAYDSLSGIKDSVIEHIIGVTGERYENLLLESIEGYTPGMCDEVAERICILAKQIENFTHINGILSVENFAQDLYGVGAKLKYKLSLNNSDEQEFIDDSGIKISEEEVSEIIPEPEVIEGETTPQDSISPINEIDLSKYLDMSKSEESSSLNLDYLTKSQSEINDELEKSNYGRKRAVLGEKRTWSDGTYTLTHEGWLPIKSKEYHDQKAKEHLNKHVDAKIKGDTVLADKHEKEMLKHARYAVHATPSIDMNEIREMSEELPVKSKEELREEATDSLYNQMGELQDTQEFKGYLEENGYDEDERNPEDWIADALDYPEGHVIHKLVKLNQELNDLLDEDTNQSEPIVETDSELPVSQVEQLVSQVQERINSILERKPHLQFSSTITTSFRPEEGFNTTVFLDKDGNILNRMSNDDEDLKDMEELVVLKNNLSTIESLEVPISQVDIETSQPTLSVEVEYGDSFSFVDQVKNIAQQFGISTYRYADEDQLDLIFSKTPLTDQQLGKIAEEGSGDGHNNSTVSVPKDVFLDLYEGVSSSLQDLGLNVEEESSSDNKVKLNISKPTPVVTTVEKVETPVLGITSSGKKVYEGFNHPSHNDFTVDDHRDAVRLLLESDNTPMEQTDLHLQKYRSMYKSQVDELEKSSEDTLEKGGRRALNGEIRKWGNEQWVKHSDGWVHLSSTGKHTIEKTGGKREPASEEHIAHAKKHLEEKQHEDNTIEHMGEELGRAAIEDGKREYVEPVPTTPVKDLESIWNNLHPNERSLLLRNQGASAYLSVRGKKYSELDDTTKQHFSNAIEMRDGAKKVQDLMAGEKYSSLEDALKLSDGSWSVDRITDIRETVHGNYSIDIDGKKGVKINKDSVPGKQAKKLMEEKFSKTSDDKTHSDATLLAGFTPEQYRELNRWTVGNGNGTYTFIGTVDDKENGSVYHSMPDESKAEFWTRIQGEPGVLSKQGKVKGLKNDPDLQAEINQKLQDGFNSTLNRGQSTADDESKLVEEKDKTIYCLKAGNVTKKTFLKEANDLWGKYPTSYFLVNDKYIIAGSGTPESYIGKNKTMRLVDDGNKTTKFENATVRYPGKNRSGGPNIFPNKTALPRKVTLFASNAEDFAEKLPSGSYSMYAMK